MLTAKIMKNAIDNSSPKNKINNILVMENYQLQLPAQPSTLFASYEKKSGRGSHSPSRVAGPSTNIIKRPVFGIPPINFEEVEDFEDHINTVIQAEKNKNKQGNPLASFLSNGGGSMIQTGQDNAGHQHRLSNELSLSDRIQKTNPWSKVAQIIFSPSHQLGQFHEYLNKKIDIIEKIEKYPFQDQNDQFLLQQKREKQANLIKFMKTRKRISQVRFKTKQLSKMKLNGKVQVGATQPENDVLYTSPAYQQKMQKNRSLRESLDELKDMQKSWDQLIKKNFTSTKKPASNPPKFQRGGTKMLIVESISNNIENNEYNEQTSVQAPTVNASDAVDQTLFPDDASRLQMFLPRQNIASSLRQFKPVKRHLKALDSALQQCQKTEKEPSTAMELRLSSFANSQSRNKLQMFQTDPQRGSQHKLFSPSHKQYSEINPVKNPLRTLVNPILQSQRAGSFAGTSTHNPGSLRSPIDGSNKNLDKYQFYIEEKGNSINRETFTSPQSQSVVPQSLIPMNSGPHLRSSFLEKSHSTSQDNRIALQQQSLLSPYKERAEKNMLSAFQTLKKSNLEEKSLIVSNSEHHFFPAKETLHKGFSSVQSGRAEIVKTGYSKAESRNTLDMLAQNKSEAHLFDMMLKRRPQPLRSSSNKQVFKLKQLKTQLHYCSTAQADRPDLQLGPTLQTLSSTGVLKASGSTPHTQKGGFRHAFVFNFQ